MRRAAVLFALALAVAFPARPEAETFKEQQLKHARVRTAVKEKEATLKELFAERGFSYPPGGIFIRIFKSAASLELWVKKTGGDAYELFKEYKVCDSSGEPGPKRKRGDSQVPEGFYHVSGFNPYSNFYLSMRINYPNESDRILGAKGKWGGDIFIHGSCVTIGCVPITDDGIKEAYLLVVEAKSAGQERIPVHIFPAKLDEEGMKKLESEYGENRALLDFWRNLKEGFDYFEKNRKLPSIKVGKDGRYVIGN